jgi:hypothetical protein
VGLPSCLHIPTILKFIPHRLLLTASGPFLTVLWGRTSDLRLLLGDVVHEWLVVSLFSGLVFTVFWCQLTIPKLYLNTGNANNPNAWIYYYFIIIIILEVKHLKCQGKLYCNMRTRTVT